MPTSSQTGKTRVESLIDKENTHFQLAAARMVRIRCIDLNMTVPPAVTNRIDRLSQELEADKKLAKETRYIQLGRQWMGEFLDSSATFGRNTSLIRTMQAEVAHRQLDRERYRREAQQNFSNPIQQSQYIGDKMKSWTFNDPYLRARIAEQVEEFCPAYHPQHAQQQSNVIRAVIRAFTTLKTTMSEAESAQIPTHQHPQTRRLTLQEQEDLQARTRLPWNPEDPSWHNPPKTPEQEEEVLHPNHDNDEDETLKPTPVAKQPKYVQAEFSLDQNIKQ